MRRVVNIVLAAVASATLLTGCVFGHDMKTDDPVELRCRPVMAPGSRTAAAESEAQLEELFPTNTDIGLWAFALPRDKEWAVFSPDAEPFAQGERFTHNDQDGLWYPSQRLNWSYPEALTIVAYAPFEQAASFDPKRGLVIADYDSEKNRNLDLMYTFLLEDRLCEKNKKGVDVPFYHALSTVDVKVTTSLQENKSIVIRAVYFEDICTQGTFNSLPYPQWHTEIDKQTVTMYEGVENEGWSLPENNGHIITDGYRYLIPQIGTTRIVVVADVLMGGMIQPEQRFVTKDINFIWEPGRHYTYSLTISSESLRYEEPDPDKYV